MRRQSRRKAIGRTLAAVVIIVILIIAGVGIIALNSLSNHSTTSTTTSSTTSSGTATSTGSTTSSSITSSSTPNTLTIDDVGYPGPDLSELDTIYAAPYPNWFEQSVYQSLLNVNETAEFQHGQIDFVPELASNWTVSSDGETYTFNLRSGVTYSNGDAFNAYQVWMDFYGIYYLTANSSTWLDSLPIFAMSNANFGPATVNFITANGGVTNPNQAAIAIMSNSSWPMYAPTPYQFVFHLTEPYSFFPSTLIDYDGLIFDSQFVLAHGGFGNATALNTYFATNPIPGTGPYMTSQIQVNSYVEFTQNPTYWAANQPNLVAQNPFLDPGHFKNIIVKGVTDDLARYTDLSSGQAQMATIQTADWNQITSQPNVYQYGTLPPYNGFIAALAFNTQSYPTNITDVRLALVHAINNSQITQEQFNGNLRPLVGPEYPVFSNYYNLGNFDPYSYNLTLAKQYLSTAGFPNGQGLPTLTFTVDSLYQGWTLTQAQIVKADLAQIGVNVNIEVQAPSLYYPYSTYAANLAGAQQEGQITEEGGGGWAPITLSPADAWTSFVSNESSIGNYAIYSNPVVQKCADAFISTTNTSLITSLCIAAQAQVYNDAPYDWTGSYVLNSFSGSFVWKTGVISSYLIDPQFGANTDIPLLNTIAPGPNF